MIPTLWIKERVRVEKKIQTFWPTQLRAIWNGLDIVRRAQLQHPPVAVSGPWEALLQWLVIEWRHPCLGAAARRNCMDHCVTQVQEKRKDYLL